MKNVKVVILAGGHGTRLAEETEVRPKPMVEIGERPILWHIMKIYSQQGFNDFVICLGYKGYVIKEFFRNYMLHSSDVTFDLVEDKMTIHSKRTEPWKVTLVDTGSQTMTGGRLLRIKPFVEKDEKFMLTYGDGVADIDIRSLLSFHDSKKRAATVTAVIPPGRFGSLDIDSSGSVTRFTEKPAGDGYKINGGFFVFTPRVFDFIEGDHTYLEQEPLKGLAAEGNLAAYTHDGFWHPMDTLRDKHHLEALWQKGQAPWKTWS